MSAGAKADIFGSKADITYEASRLWKDEDPDAFEISLEASRR